jgi:hypothetical protein
MERVYIYHRSIVKTMYSKQIHVKIELNFSSPVGVKIFFQGSNYHAAEQLHTMLYLSFKALKESLMVSLNLEIKKTSQRQFLQVPN